MSKHPKVTIAMLKEATLPPNNCQVRKLLDSITDLETLETLGTAVDMPARALTANRLIEILNKWGFSDDVIPVAEHIAAHRSGKLPCRCREYAKVIGETVA